MNPPLLDLGGGGGTEEGLKVKVRQRLGGRRKRRREKRDGRVGRKEMEISLRGGGQKREEKKREENSIK
jgi:hypothetical protein